MKNAEKETAGPDQDNNNISGLSHGGGIHANHEHGRVGNVVTVEWVGESG